MAKKFPLGRVRELAAHVAGLHEHLQGLLSDCDAAQDDGVIRKTARDDSDAGTEYGNDAAAIATAVMAAIRAEADAPKPMDYLFNRK